MNFTVPGKPQPKQRARKGAGGRWYTPAPTKAYEASVGGYAWHVSTQHCDAFGAPWPLLRTYAVEIECHFPDKRRRDIDNVAKSVLDGCNGILWDDDSQVVKLTTTRHLDRENPRTVVRVEVVD